MFRLKRVPVHKSPQQKSKEAMTEEESHDFHQKWIERAMTSPSNVIQAHDEAPRRPGLIKVQKPSNLDQNVSTSSSEMTSEAAAVGGPTKPNRPKPARKRHRRRRKSLEEKELLERKRLQKALEKEGPLPPRQKQQPLPQCDEGYSITLPTRSQFLRKLSSTLTEIPENGYVNDTNCKNHRVVNLPSKTNRRRVPPSDVRKTNRERLQSGSVSLDDIMDDDNDETENNIDSSHSSPSSPISEENEETKECEQTNEIKSAMSLKNSSDNRRKKRPSRFGKNMDKGMGDIYMATRRNSQPQPKLVRGTSMDSLIQELNYTSTHFGENDDEDSSKNISLSFETRTRHSTFQSVTDGDGSSKTSPKPILQMRKEQDKQEKKWSNSVRGVSLDEVLSNTRHGRDNTSSKTNKGIPPTTQSVYGRSSPDTVLDFDQSFEDDVIHERGNEKNSPNKSYNKLAMQASSPYKRGTSLDSVFIPNAIVSLGGNIPHACSQLSEKARLDGNQRIGYTV